MPLDAASAAHFRSSCCGPRLSAYKAVQYLSSGAEHTLNSNLDDMMSSCGQHLNANLLQYVPHGAIHCRAPAVHLVTSKLAGTQI